MCAILPNSSISALGRSGTETSSSTVSSKVKEARRGLAPERAFRPVPAADVLGGPDAIEHLGDVQRSVLQRALLRAEGNVSAAAKALGVSRATLHRKLKRFDLRPH